MFNLSKSTSTFIRYHRFVFMHIIRIVFKYPFQYLTFFLSFVQTVQDEPITPSHER